MIGLRRALWALAIAGAVVLGAQVVLISEAGFVSDQGLWIALDIFIGGGFVGVGLFAWYRRPDNRVGALMVATGFAWLLGLSASPSRRSCSRSACCSTTSSSPRRSTCCSPSPPAAC